MNGWVSPVMTWTGTASGRSFAHQVFQAKTWLARRKIPVLYVDYLDCLVKPLETSIRLNAFLGGSLETSAMAEVVDTRLYRQRRG